MFGGLKIEVLERPVMELSSPPDGLRYPPPGRDKRLEARREPELPKRGERPTMPEDLKKGGA